jgi:hypothetical protein
MDAWRAEAREWLRPWKLATLAASLGLVVWGAFRVGAPDWDVGICFVMGVPTYLSAPFGVRAVLERRWARLPLALVLAWVSVDGVYWGYWHFKDPVVLGLMRGANFAVSFWVYWLCGCAWAYRGSLTDLGRELRRVGRAKGRGQDGSSGHG